MGTGAVMSLSSYIIPCILATSLLLPAPTPAQITAELALGANLGVRDDLESQEDIDSSRVGAVYAGRVFWSDVRDTTRDQRIGLSVVTHRVQGIPAAGDDYAWNYRATFIEAEIEGVLWRGSRATLLGSLGLGLLAISVRNENSAWNYCEAPFCRSPDWSWSASPGLRFLVPLTGALSATLGVRGNVFNEDGPRYAPFGSGLMLLAGLSWRPAPGARTPPRHPSEPTPR